MALLTERYADKIRGQLSCYDRIVIQGTLPGLCYAQRMTTFLKHRCEIKRCKKHAIHTSVKIFQDET